MFGSNGPADYEILKEITKLMIAIRPINQKPPTLRKPSQTLIRLLASLWHGESARELSGTPVQR